MMKRIAAFICIVLIIAAFFTGTAFAAKSVVVDDADLLSTDEESKLENKINEIRNEYGVQLVIVTADSTDGKTSMAYADDFYDYNGYGVGSDKSGALFLIDMYNREIYISTTGSCTKTFSQSRIEKMLDAAQDEIYDDYYEACDAFLSKAEDYLKVESKGFLGKITLLLMGICAAIGAGVGALGTVILVAGRGGRIATSAMDYMVPGSGKVLGQRDTFVNRTVVRTPIPKNTGSKGGGGGFHTGSSGTFHGGGGRKF